MTFEHVYVFVSINGVYTPAGLLRPGGREGFFFRYGNKYLERENSFSLDPATLPLTRDEFYSQGLFNVFRDAAPDRWGRRLLSLMAGRHYGEMSEMEILTSLHSEERVGALAFGPTTEQPQSMAPWAQQIPSLTREQELEAILDIVAEVDQLSDDSLVDSLRQSLPHDVFLQALASSLSLGGARPKASVHHEGTLWIAKFPKRGDPWNEPRVEYATMLLAAKCGIQTPEVRCVSFSNGDVLLVKRFDRAQGQPRHMISGFTLSRLQEDGSWGSYQMMAENARRFGAVDDGEEIFRRMVFNALCSNRDDHPRNHAFFVERKRLCMTPAYDLVPSSVSFSNWELSLACGIEGRVVGIDNLLSDTQPFGLHPAEAEQILEDMCSVVGQWEEHYVQCGVTTKELERLSSRFELCREVTDRPVPG